METPERSNPTAEARRALDNWLSETPAVVRGLTLATIVCFVLGTTFGTHMVATIPALVMWRLEVYRLVMSPFFEDGVIGAFFVILWLNRGALAAEKEMGTKKFGYLLATLSVGSNLMFCVLSLVLGYSFGLQTLLFRRCQGLFPALLGLLVVRPPGGQVSLAFFPSRVSPQALPWVILGISSLFSGTLLVDLLSGILVGHLYIKVRERMDEAGLPTFMPAIPPETTAASRGGWGGQGHRLGSMPFPQAFPSANGYLPVATEVPSGPDVDTSKTVGTSEERQKKRNEMLEAAQQRLATNQRQQQVQQPPNQRQGEDETDTAKG